MRTRTGLPDVGIGAQVDHRVVDRLLLALDDGLEAGVLAVAAVERADEVEPVLLAVGDLVEDLLHLGGEADVDVVGEVLAQQPRDGKRREARHQRLALARDVAAALDGGDRRRVGRRPADAFFLEPLDQRRFGVARRRRGLVALGGRAPATIQRLRRADRARAPGRRPSASAAASPARRAPPTDRRCPRRRRAGSRQTRSPCRWP